MERNTENLKIAVMDNIANVGKEIDEYLMEKYDVDKSFILPMTIDRFNNGEGKVTVDRTIRDKDIFILSDVGNYSITYKMHGMNVPVGPDEHFQDIKRCISALSGYARRLTVIEPLLYQSRQDKRENRESLDCAIALKELEHMHVNHIVTFDAHNKAVANAIPNIPFENFYPTNTILEQLIPNEEIDNILAISPDAGAVGRATYYADMLRCNVGMFHKRRDVNTIVDGKNPIIAHEYIGPDVEGKTCIVVDDMIASGGSIIDVGAKLREKGAKKIIFVTTFALFTSGIEVFKKAYEDGLFDKLYTTNLSYIPAEYNDNEWLNVVNCSTTIAEIIDHIHNGQSLKNIVHNNKNVLKLLNTNNNKSN